MWTNKEAIRQQLSKKYGWRLYTTRVLAQRKIWDLLYSRTMDDLLKSSALYDRVAPPSLLNDPILQHPDIILTSHYIDVFSRPTHEYVYHLKHSVTIEPKYGYAIAKPLSLLDVSVPRSESTRSPDTMLDFSGLPSVKDFMTRKRRGAKTIHVDAVCTLRYSHEENYYHILQDMLSRISMLDKYGVDPAIPIVISRATADRKFFQQMQERPELAKRNWLVQDGFYIDANEIYLTRTAEGNSERLISLVQMLGSSTATLEGSRRVFVVRDGLKYGRGILNLDEIRPVLQRHNFDVIDPEHMDFSDQTILFSQIDTLVGAHGAGLINMIFRCGAPMRLLELFPPTETSLHFYLIARALGYNYDFLVGHSPDGKGRGISFHVDPEVLDEKLVRLLADN